MKSTFKLSLLTLAFIFSFSTATQAQNPPPTSATIDDLNIETNDENKRSFQDTLDKLLPTQSKLFNKNTNQNQLATGDLEQDIIPRFLRLLVLLSGMAITIIFTYVAFRLVLAKDDETQLTNLKTTFTQIIIGTMVILSSFAIILGIIQYFDSLR